MIEEFLNRDYSEEDLDFERMQMLEEYYADQRMEFDRENGDESLLDELEL